jgi:uncharacterized protein
MTDPGLATPNVDRLNLLSHPRLRGERHIAGDREPRRAESPRSTDAGGWRLRCVHPSCCYDSLFVPDEEVAYRNDAGFELSTTPIVRLAAGRRPVPGLPAGAEGGMTGRAEAHTNRPELVAIHGYDTKYAMHALGLAVRASSCLRPAASRCRSRSTIADTSVDPARRGRARRASPRYQQRKTRLVGPRNSSSPPDRPDRRWIDRWLHPRLDYWARHASDAAG